MKLLIVTQAVDSEDPVLGFFHAWIEEFAKHVEQVQIICLREGVHALPENVHVHSLGKEKGRVPGIVYAWRFLSLAWKLRREYDRVFVHMNPEYIVLAGALWRALGKRTILWYTHKNVDLKLRVATAWADVVCTASKESFLLPTSKLHVMGHGIDVTTFVVADGCPKNDVLRICTSGRISRTKRVQEMLDALSVLKQKGLPFRFTLIGVPVTPADELYTETLTERIEGLAWKDQIIRTGSLPHAALPQALATEDIFVNLSTTGSLDKAVLEACACGLIPVSSNPAFRDLLEPHGLFVPDASSERVAEALVAASYVERGFFRPYIQQEHSLDSLIARLITLLEPRTVK